MFWKGIWKDASHNNNTIWIAELKANHQTSAIPAATLDNIWRRPQTIGIRIKNWIALGPDMIYAYWLKKLTSLYKRLACQIEKLVTEGDHPSWLTQGRMVFVTKDPQQSSISSSYKTNHMSEHNLEASIWYTGRQDWSSQMNTCIRLRKALAVEAGVRSTNCWSTNQWSRMSEVDVQTWLMHELTARMPTIQCFIYGY